MKAKTSGFHRVNFTEQQRGTYQTKNWQHKYCHSVGNQRGLEQERQAVDKRKHIQSKEELQD